MAAGCPARRPTTTPRSPAAVGWPLPAYALRSEPLVEPFRIESGRLLAPRAPGLGVRLTPETERRFAFRGDAVHRCLTRMPSAEPGRRRTE
ncbi:hypothetical protein ACFYZN_32675 [Streptomyces sp. NPDC001777]|uniref:hypothetical protein n=1 Tax=Streptomyces sp. NPDC001777 TaxID=3364608 RepID=UPI0036B313DA